MKFLIILVVVFFINREFFMEWILEYDIIFCWELLFVNLFKEKYKIIKCVKLWDEVWVLLIKLVILFFKKSFEKCVV